MTVMEIVIAIGVWALTAVLGVLVKYIWTIARHSRETNETVEKIKTEMRGLTRQSDELWEIHLGPNAKDEDGAPKWYVRKALEENVHALAEAIGGLKDVLQAIHNDQKDIKRELQNLKK